MKAILTYHSIDDSGSVISVAPAVFRSHMAWLAASGLRVLSLEALLAAPDTGDAVAITFDDGFANFATDAWPTLRDHGFPVTVFVPTSHVGGENAWDDTVGDMPRLPLMTWETLGTVAEGGVELGAHSRTHPDLRALPDDGLRAETRGAVEILARETGRKPAGFAYPYGYVNDRVVAAVCECALWACTVRLRAVRRDDDRYRLPRLDAYYFRTPGQLEAWGTPWFLARLAIRGWAKRLRSGMR